LVTGREPSSFLEILVDFKLSVEKKLEGTISISIQKAENSPLADIKITDDEVSFAIAGVSGEPISRENSTKVAKRSQVISPSLGKLFPSISASLKPGR